MRVRAGRLLILSLLLVGIAFPASAHATGVDVTRGIVGYGTVKAGTAPDCTSPQSTGGGTNANVNTGTQYNCGAIDATQYDNCTTPDADGSFACSITLTAQAADAAGWRFDHWSGDCSGTSTTCNLPTSDTECDPLAKPPCHTTNDGPYTPVAHFVDTRAPTTTFSAAPAANSVVYSDTRSQTFTWSTNEDGEAPMSGCKKDAGTFSACSSGITWSSISDGIHDFCVHGTDASGLQGADTCRHWEQETNPTASISTHPPSTSSSPNPSFTYTSNKASHPADGSTLSYQCKLDGGAFAACPAAGQSYSSLTDGSHTFQVQAVFTAALGGGAHTSTAASYTWTVDATPPTLNFTSGPSDGAVLVDSSGHAAFGWNDSDTGTGVSSIQCKLDAAAYGPCTSATSDVLDSLADGEHTLSVKATDGVGNQRVQSVTWEQETPADTIIDSGPASGAVVSGKTAHFTFHSSKTDAPVSFQCALDSNVFSPCSGSTSDDLSGLSDGSHTLQVRAVFTASIDGSQHAGAAVSRTWKVDTTTRPWHTAAPTISGTPIAGHTLRCSKGTWSGPNPKTYAYRWLRNGQPITAATKAAYVVKAADAGKAVRCRVTASNAAGSVSATSAAVTIKSPPKNTVAPKITGTPRFGHTLSCSEGTWTGSAPIAYTRQWLRNGVAIAGATGATYVVKASDRGHSLSCRVTARNAAGQATKASAAVKVT